MSYIEKRRTDGREIVFVSFGDSRYIKSLERLKVETADFPFTTRLFLTEKDLPANFRKNLHPFHYPRGYGYWKWKPFIVNAIANELQDGDILVYSDCGNHFEKRGLKLFNEYISMADKCQSGVVTFQQPYLEKDWAKGDLLDFFGAYDKAEILVSLQLWGGAFVIRITNMSREIARKWLDVHVNHFDLTTDKQSQLPNPTGFRENRHDQATFSLIVKQYPHVELSWEGVCPLYLKDMKQYNDYPIQRSRKKETEQSFGIKIRHKILRVPRYLWAMYLVHVEHFHFIGRKVW